MGLSQRCKGDAAAQMEDSQELGVNVAVHCCHFSPYRMSHGDVRQAL